MIEYIAAGGNRHPAAADWHEEVLAYGANGNVALWNPQGDGRGVTQLLVGHTQTVNAVRFCETESALYLLTGSVDTSVRVWRRRAAAGDRLAFECVQVLQEHTSSVNCIAVAKGSSIFATGAADASVKIWRINGDPTDERHVELLQSISIKPRFFPLAMALSSLGGSSDSYVLAMGGTTAIAQLYISDSAVDPDFKLRATLSGHEGWIRSMAFTRETADETSDLLLASASQDKYIRLWRIHQGKELPAVAASGNDPALGAFMPGKSLSNRAHRFTASGNDYSATFEALLLGHEDWIYSTRWHRSTGGLQLLSASADNSLTIWEPEPSTGVWVSTVRLGEISGQKGSTTATGSTGGFWTGLFSPDGQTVVCLGRTGSWRRWNYTASEGQWLPGIGISGHVSSITGISWSQNGTYLLTTSSDQTTRLHAPWDQPEDSTMISKQATWHELARPQIHGYDLNCISTLGPTSFVSGADEKLLRVFSLPLAVGNLLSKLSNIALPALTNGNTLSDAANMPVLGLSNKAISALSSSNEIEASTAAPNNTSNSDDPVTTQHKSTLDLSHPPLEDHLSRYTLFPEIEKLYGHGYEISCLATSHDGRLVATACKASSIDHAVIRLFETERWTEVKPPLAAHASTVHRLRFSADDAFLLSVGRDRQWAVWKRGDGEVGAEGGGSPHYTLLHSDPKGHSRMILDCAWAPPLLGPGPRSAAAFATAGRDRSVKLWRFGSIGSEAGKPSVLETIGEEAPVTAVDFEATAREDGSVFLAIGTETGRLSVYEIGLEDLKVRRKAVVAHSLSPAKSITQLAWRPSADGKTMTAADGDRELAVSSEDGALRIYTLQGILTASSTDAAVC